MIECIIIKKSDEDIYCIKKIEVPENVKKKHAELVQIYNLTNIDNIYLCQNFLFDELSYKRLVLDTHEKMKNYKLEAIKCSLVEELEKDKISPIRIQLSDKLCSYTKIYGKIDRFGKMQFDGYERIMSLGPGYGMYNPIRRYDSEPIELLRHVDQSTLLKECKIDDTIIGDGHLWLPDNLEKKGYKINDTITVVGHIEKYKRKDGTFDYCIKPSRYEQY